MISIEGPKLEIGIDSFNGVPCPLLSISGVLLDTPTPSGEIEFIQLKTAESCIGLTRREWARVCEHAAAWWSRSGATPGLMPSAEELEDAARASDSRLAELVDLEPAALGFDVVWVKSLAALGRIEKQYGSDKEFFGPAMPGEEPFQWTTSCCDAIRMLLLKQAQVSGLRVIIMFEEVEAKYPVDRPEEFVRGEFIDGPFRGLRDDA
jgi:hypothetical protein